MVRGVGEKRLKRDFAELEGVGRSLKGAFFFYGWNRECVVIW